MERNLRASKLGYIFNILSGPKITFVVSLINEVLSPGNAKLES